MIMEGTVTGIIYTLVTVTFSSSHGGSPFYESLMVGVRLHSLLPTPHELCQQIQVGLQCLCYLPCLSTFQPWLPKCRSSKASPTYIHGNAFNGVSPIYLFLKAKRVKSHFTMSMKGILAVHSMPTQRAWGPSASSFNKLLFITRRAPTPTCSWSVAVPLLLSMVLR